ncbi:hypothetical protein Tco_0781419 [Tanacetum coccineum]
MKMLMKSNQPPQMKVDAFEKDKLAQATEILKWNLQRKLVWVLRRMHPNKGVISDIDADAEISLVDETQRLDDDLIFDTTVDLGGEEVVVKPAETGVSPALNFSKYIFESMVRNVDSSAKFLMYPRFIQVFLDNQVDDMTIHHTKYTSPALTQKVFENMRRVGKGFYGNETPLFDTMLVQPQTQADEDVKMHVDEEQPATASAPSISEPQDQPSIPHDSLEQEPTHSSPYDSPLTGVNLPRSEEGSLQLAELMALCITLHRKVDALEKDKLAQATKILSLKKRVEKLEKRRKSKPSVLRIGSATRISLVDETQRLDDDLIFDTTADLGGEEVVVKPAETSVGAALDVEVSAAEPAVTTVSSLVTTNSVTITAVEPVITTTKPKAKGITIQEPLVTQKITVSFISSSKGKVIMIESEKPVKIKDLSAHDEQVAKDLHDKFQVELEKEAKRQEEASMAALAELHDVVQAQIDADRELAARMTLEEHEKYTVEERARMLAEFIKNKKKQLAVERAEAIRSKPPTKSQLRNLMMTYLKNIGRFTHAQLKHKDFEEIQGLYNKEKELVDTFVHIGSEEDERKIKDLNTNKRKKRIRMKRSSKKQKTKADLKEEEQLKTFLSIVPNEEEVIDYEVLDKRYQIVDWKSKFYLNDRYREPYDYYRVFRAGGSSRYIKTFTEMVSRFDRMDFLKLHSLVMQRFETTNPEGIDLILWGDLKTIVHILMLEDGTEFHMLAERKYPLTKETLEKMLVLRMTTESDSKAAFDLLRLVLLVEDFAAAEVLKNLLQVVSAVRVNINTVFFSQVFDVSTVYTSIFRTTMDEYDQPSTQSYAFLLSSKGVCKYERDKDVEMPVAEEQPATTSAPSTYEPQDQPSTPHDSPKQEPTHSSPYDSPLTGVNPPRSEEGSLQLAELMALCTSLQRKVDSLEKDKLAQATEILKEASLGAEENASKQGGMISDIDVEISLVDETQRLDDDLIFDTTADLVGEKVVMKPAETGVSVALDVEELTDNDMTMAEALAELKTSKPKVVTTIPILNSATIVTTTKPKAKGITIQEPSVTQKTAISFISSFEGKAIMIESKKPVKIKDLSAHDEQVAKDLHDKIQVELEEEASMLLSCWFTHAQLKHRDFEEIQGLYNKEKELVDTFVPIGYEEDERMIKDLNTKAEEESSNKDVDSTNKRKIMGDLMTIYRVFRADGSSRYIKTFTEMVSRFDRMDFLELHSLVMQRFETTTPEGIDLILWGDLKTMFEANAVDELWKNQEDWILKSWNLYENCGVHILMLEDGTEFHMLAERKYPLTKETLEKMLVLRLTAESESEAAFDLLRFIQKQIDEM